MDDNFFKQLDEALTNVGSDKYWERKIGGHAVWLSPVPFKSQHKINELLSNSELGANIIGEVKRMTLSYAIVGFDGHDLRPYRNDTPQFPTFDSREKKQVKVALHKYLSHKMEEWGTEWVDSAFEVFADIMETVKKENLKEVKFDNAKNKRDELDELEEKVRDLRDDLDMPRLVEEKPEPEKPVTTEPVVPVVPESVPEPFSPFQKLPQAVVEPFHQTPVVPVPTVVTPTMPTGAKSVEIDGVGTTSSPGKPYVAGMPVDVIEERPPRDAPPPIEIDPVRQSINPRFKQVR